MKKNTSGRKKNSPDEQKPALGEKKKSWKNKRTDGQTPVGKRGNSRKKKKGKTNKGLRTRIVHGVQAQTWENLKPKKNHAKNSTKKKRNERKKG